jgi:hypothetical protein
MTLSASCLSSLPSRFIPNSSLLLPVTCAVNIAASPSTTTFPLPNMRPVDKSRDAWARIASSVQAWVVVHWEDPQRLEPIRIPEHLIPINAPPAEDCTPEAMRTQACANQCMDFKGLLFAQTSGKSVAFISSFEPKVWPDKLLLSEALGLLRFKLT